MAKLAKACD